MVLVHVRLRRWKFVEHPFVSIDTDPRPTFGAFTSKRNQPGEANRIGSMVVRLKRDLIILALQTGHTIGSHVHSFGLGLEAVPPLAKPLGAVYTGSARRLEGKKPVMMAQGDLPDTRMRRRTFSSFGSTPRGGPMIAILDGRVSCDNGRQRDAGRPPCSTR
jgi:hypothetical protein